jgi:FAD/FMN-containing dehydrogenase
MCIHQNVPIGGPSAAKARVECCATRQGRSGEANDNLAFIARPRNVDEVAAVVRHFVANDIAIVPQAGILVDGAAAHTEGPHAIISLERMIAIKRAARCPART